MLPKLSHKDNLVQDAVSDSRAARVVVKLGGSIIDQSDHVLEAVVAMNRAGIAVCLVHGGGPNISSTLAKLKKEWQFVQGLRVTDSETLEVVKTTINELTSSIVSKLQFLGAQADSSVEQGTIRAEKKYIRDDHGKDVDIGWVGDVTDVDLGRIDRLFASNVIPVIAPIGIDQHGQHYNINADEVAIAVAVKIGADVLIYLTDTPGICDQSGTVIAEVAESEIERLIAEGILTAGMIPKARSCAAAVRAGVGSVIVTSSIVPHQLLYGVTRPSGTCIVSNN